MNENQITFKGRQYEITAVHSIPALLAAEGLQAQMTIVGKRGAARLYQVWNYNGKKFHKTISTGAVVEVELIQ